MYRSICMMIPLFCCFVFVAEQDNAVAMPQGEPRTMAIVLPPNLDAKSKEDFILEFQKKVNIENKAKQSSCIVLLEGKKGKSKVSFKFEGGAIQRKKMFDRALVDLRAFLKTIEPGDSILDVPAVCSQLPAHKLPQNTTIVFYGNPLFKGDTSDDGYFDMRQGGYTPRPKLFVVPRDESIFSTVGRNLDGLRFSFVISDETQFENSGHEQRVLDCWATYFHLQNATLTQWGSDLSVAFEEAARKDFKPVVTVDFKPTGEARMFRKVRVFGSDDEKDQEKIRPGQGGRQNEQGDESFDEKSLSENLEVPRDKDDNPIGRKFDLDGDTKIKGKVVMLLLGPADLCNEILSSPLQEALKTKIAVEVLSELPGDKELEAALRDATQLWVWSNHQKTFSNAHLKAIAKRLQEGMSCCLLADNEPWVHGCTEILKLFDTSATISGNNQGLQNLEARIDGRGAGFEKEHPIFHNCNRLFEGDTISVPRGDKLETICWASNGEPLIATLRTQQTKIVILGGFTAFMKKNWGEKAGSERFIFNTLSWLARK